MGGRGARQSRPSRVNVGSGAGELPEELSESQLDAVEYYVSGDGMYINDYLRDRNNPVERMGEMRESDKQIVRELDKATDVMIGGNETLYRSVDASAVFGNISNSQYGHLVSNLVYGDNQAYVLRQINGIVDRAKGKTVTDKGFASTSKNYDVVSDWDGFTGSSKPIVLELKTSSKTKGLDLSKRASNLNARMGQDEVLLARNQSYTINSISARDGNIYVKATLK